MLRDRLAAIKPVRADSVEIITGTRRASYSGRTHALAHSSTNRGNRSSYSFPSVANFLIALRTKHARVNTDDRGHDRRSTMYRFTRTRERPAWTAFNNVEGMRNSFRPIDGRFGWQCWKRPGDGLILLAIGVRCDRYVWNKACTCYSNIFLISLLFGIITFLFYWWLG